MSDNSLVKQQNAVLAGTGHPWVPKAPKDETRLTVKVTLEVPITYYTSGDGCNVVAGWNVDQTLFEIARKVEDLAEAQAQSDWGKDHGHGNNDD